MQRLPRPRSIARLVRPLGKPLADALAFALARFALATAQSLDWILAPGCPDATAGDGGGVAGPAGAGRSVRRPVTQEARL